MAKCAQRDTGIPVDGLRLRAAFELYWRAVTPGWKELDHRWYSAFEEWNNALHSDDSHGGPLRKKYISIGNEREKSRGAAELSFRGVLCNGELQAFAHDPGTELGDKPHTIKLEPPSYWS